MNFLDLIELKRTKQELNKEQIQYFVDAVVNNKIPDYQFSAMLMAINVNGLTLQETYYLTNSMLHSGNIISLSKIKGIKIDKHSTGGVGDKVSIILGPICAALGLKVAKMSGKGLGHTGGTIDKLNSIGVNTDLSMEQCKKLLAKDGLFITSQTHDIVPADKIIYDMRNATSTVDSIPLIASSIASKKAAMGTDYIFIDVKVGDGGFCKTIEKATSLAKTIVYLLKKFNKKSIVHITNMNQPLGRSIGNALEIRSSINFLKGKYESIQEKELIFEFISDILVFTKLAKNKKEALAKIEHSIASHEAIDKFYEWISSQHANADLIKKDKFFNPKYHYEIKATKSGFIKYKSTKEVGMVSFLLGAGRVTKQAPIDYQAGIYLNKVMNENVKKNETIATLYSSKKIDKSLIKRFMDNVLFSSKKFEQYPNIVKIIK